MIFIFCCVTSFSPSPSTPAVNSLGAVLVSTLGRFDYGVVEKHCPVAQCFACKIFQNIGIWVHIHDRKSYNQLQKSLECCWGIIGFHTQRRPFSIGKKLSYTSSFILLHDSAIGIWLDHVALNSHLYGMEPFITTYIRRSGY